MAVGPLLGEQPDLRLRAENHGEGRVPIPQILDKARNRIRRSTADDGFVRRRPNGARDDLPALFHGREVGRLCCRRSSRAKPAANSQNEVVLHLGAEEPRSRAFQEGRGACVAADESFHVGAPPLRTCAATRLRIKNPANQTQYTTANPSGFGQANHPGVSMRPNLQSIGFSGIASTEAGA